MWEWTESCYSGKQKFTQIIFLHKNQFDQKDKNFMGKNVLRNYSKN